MEGTHSFLLSEDSVVNETIKKRSPKSTTEVVAAFRPGETSECKHAPATERNGVLHPSGAEPLLSARRRLVRERPPCLTVQMRIRWCRVRRV
jgi:hypothetical protein